MRKLLFLIPLLIAFGLFGFFYAGLKDGRDPSALPSALLDKPAPQFDLPALLADRPGLATADLKGSVQLVNVFASWCVPCRAEHPILMRMAKEDGLTIHGIAYKDKPEDSRAFLASLGNPYDRVGLDESGRTAIDWGVYGVPETYVVDRDGIIRWKYTGPLTPELLDGKILPLIESLRK